MAVITSATHQDEDIATLLRAYDEIIPILDSAIKKKTLYDKLKAEPLQPLFKVR